MTSHARIAEAINDDDWQKFRRSMKGETTKQKLTMLRAYYLFTAANTCRKQEDIAIRCDNYLKALARGGLLFPGVSLDSALKDHWQLKIKRG